MRKRTFSKILGAILACLIIASMFGGLPSARNVEASSSYDVQTAVSYANVWCNGRNPSYNSYSQSGGDCANFVSQCLIAGGLDLTVCSSSCWVDNKGSLPRCDDLHTYLTSYLGAQYEARSRSENEPSWFLPGDVAIFGDTSDHWKHAVFAVSGDAAHWARCAAHDQDVCSTSISEFFSANPSFTLCNYYHVSGEINPQPSPPSPPTLISPGSVSSPGLEIDTLTPTFRWNEVPNADYYGLYIRDMDADVLAFDSQKDYGPIYGNYFVLPSGILDDGIEYRWNMRAHNSAGWGAIFSERLHFRVKVTPTYPIVESFNVQPSSITEGEQFTISYTVSDTGGSGLKQIELWRGSDDNGTAVWPQDPTQTDPISGSRYTGQFQDTPPSSGFYWYGVHVVDNNDLWNDERNSHTGGSPGVFGPIKVAVKSNQSPQLTNGYVDPSNGDTSTNFYYYVTYFDPDGDDPSVRQVYIDGTVYSMSWYSGSNSHITYRYGPKNLSSGSHSYYLYFEDGRGGTVRLPTSGSHSGPTVSQPTYPPQVTTTGASSKTTSSATLNGNLDSTGGLDCQVWFEYGATTSYGSSTTPLSRSSTGSFSATISGLNDDTTYHFRACASNSKGTSYGSDVTFKTEQETHPPDIGYAVIVAGDDNPGFDTDGISGNANTAYQALLTLGFDDERIFYLNRDRPQDIDGDGDDEVDRSSSFSDFQYVMEQWVPQRVGEHSPLILYLVGHGAKDTFAFGDGDGLGPLTLDNWLAQLPSGTRMLIIIDTCYSGSFITVSGGGISAPNRVIVTSADDSSESDFVAFAGSLFSREFWHYIAEGRNVKEAFIEGTNDANQIGQIIPLGYYWDPWLDDNGDAVGHSPLFLGDDGQFAATMIIGVPGGPPSVGEGAPNPQLFIDCYNRIGGASILGYPVNKAHRWGNGYIQDFRGGEGYEGAIMQPDGASSAYAVYGSIWSRYLTLGGAEGPLGYPTTDETEGKTSSITSARCRYNKFDGGAIVHRKATDGYESKTVFLGWGIFNKWEYLNHGQGVLGLPTSDEKEASQSGADSFDTAGVVCDFEGGHMHWHRTGSHTNQAFETHGAIDSVYAQMGGSGSWLGFPVTDKYTNASGYPQSDFEGGYITTTDGVNYQAFHYAVAEPDIGSIAPIDFGNVAIGSSKEMTTTISNHGTAPLIINSIARTAGSSDFTLIAPSIASMPFGVGSGQSTIPIDIAFTPTSSGLKQATFTVSSNDPDTPEATFSVSGNGIALGAGLADSPWPMFGHDFRHTGQSPTVGPQTNNLKWSLQLNSEPAFILPAIASDGTIYAVWGETWTGTLYAVNPEGTIKWHFGNCRHSYATPAIAADGTIYVTARHSSTAGIPGHVSAINPDGTLKWSLQIKAYDSSPLIGPDGTVYIGGDNALYAINPDGTIKWQWPTEGGYSLPSSPAFGIDGSVLIAGRNRSSGGDMLYSVNRDSGVLIWQLDIPGTSIWDSSPVVSSEGTIYIGTAYGEGGILYAVKSDGSLKWKTKKLGTYIYATPALGLDGTIYIGVNNVTGTSGALYAVAPDGRVKWSYPTDGGFYGAPAIDSDGTIYYASTRVSSGVPKGIVFALYPDGSLKWEYTLDSWVYLILCLGADGTLYVGAGDSVLHAFGADTTSPTISSVLPKDGATNVSVGTVTRATFSETIDASTVTSDSFTLMGGAVSGTITYDSETFTATFMPSANLAYGTTYTATLKTTITDAAGNPLAAQYTWSFTTESAPNKPPVLSNGQVSPGVGYASTRFTYSITYTDADNDPPATLTVSIDSDTPQNMSVKEGEDGDYTNGEVYECTATGLQKDISHVFQFAANDGEDNATGDIGVQEGPTVNNTPPSVDSVSISPGPAQTNSDLAATPSGWYDLDDDAEGYQWQWQKLVFESWQDIEGANTDNLDSSNFMEGDVIKVICTPFDGTDTGNPVDDTITISGRPEVHITSPEDEYFTTDATITVQGTVVATPALNEATLTVNGVSRAIAVTDGYFSEQVTLLKGANTISVSASNLAGTDSDSITITRNCKPVVTITSPKTGSVFQSATMAVKGTVDAIPAVTEVNIIINEGDDSESQTNAAVTNGQFSKTVDLPIEGQNTVRVSATNAAGTGTSPIVTVTLNTEAPAVTINSPASGLVTNTLTITVSGTVIDVPQIAQATLTVNGVSKTINVSATDNSFSESVRLIEEANTIKVTATDGTHTGSYSITIALDTVPPIVSITSPPNNYVTSNETVTIIGRIDDTSITQAILTLNGTDNTITVSAGAFSQQVTLQNGRDTIKVSATDSAGNNGTSGCIIVTYDNTKPSVTITSPSSGHVTGNALLTVTGTVTTGSPITQSTLVLNGNDILITITANNFSKGITLSPGLNTIEIKVKDSATPPNTGSSGIITVTLDKTAPKVAIISPTEGLLSATASVTIIGTIDDPSVTSATLRLNGIDSTIDVSDGAFDVTKDLRQGTNTILVTASDAYGNKGTSGTVTVEVHTGKPAVTVDTPSTGLVTNVSSLPVSGTVVHSQAIAEMTLTLNGVSRTIDFSEIGSEWEFGTTINLVEGINTIVVRASDNATPPNKGSSGVVIVTRDTKAPTIDLVSPAPGLLINEPNLAVSGTIDDPNVTTATLTVNGSDEIIPVQAGAFEWTVTNLNQGENTIEVSATDRVGNTGTTDTVTIVLDTAALKVTITSPANGYRIKNTSLAVNGSVVDVPPISQATLILNGSTRTITVTNDAFSEVVTLAEGENIIAVSATDGVNVGNSGTIVVTLDTTPPVLTVSLSDPTDTILIIVKSNEALQSAPAVSVNSTVDMTLVGPNKWSGTYPAESTLAEGSYTVSITGTDTAGNQASETVSFCKQTVTTDNRIAQVSTNTTTVEIHTTHDVQNASISVTQHMENPAENAESGIEAGVFLEVVASPELRDAIDPDEGVTIGVEYDEDYIVAQGIEESSLKLYLWNVTTGQWEEVPGSYVNTEENRIWGTVYHLSKYGGFGTVKEEEPERPPGGGGGGGGGGGPGMVKLNGLTATTELLVDRFGRAQETYQLKSLDEKVSLNIARKTKLLDSQGEPLESLSAEVVASPPAPPAERAVICAYDFGPDGATFEPAIILTMSYDPEILPEEVTEDGLYIAYWDGSQWLALESTVDSEANTVSTEISHFTQFALIGKLPPPPPEPETAPAPARVPAPASFAVFDLSVAPSEVKPAEQVTISAIVTNTGGSRGSYTVVLKINGAEEARKEVTLGAGKSETVTFIIAKDTEGSYTVNIDGKVGQFTVIAPPPPRPEEEEVAAVPPTIINWGLVGGIIAGCVVVIGLLVYFFVWRKRSAPKTS